MYHVQCTMLMFMYELLLDQTSTIVQTGSLLPTVDSDASSVSNGTHIDQIS